MARHIPTIRAGVLIVEPSAGGDRLEVPPESDAWFQWLESARTFAFEDSSGHFTARKKRRWGVEYWYAFRRGSGRLYETYLGKAHNITLGRLRAVAVKLSQPATRPLEALELRVEAPANLSPPHASETDRARSRLSTDMRPVPDAAEPPFIRTSAVERLAQAADYALTTVSAPAGYGKTTLLMQASDALGLTTAWLTLDERDNDPMRLWTRVVAALQLAAPGLLEPAALSARDDGPRSVDVLLAALLTAVSHVPSPILLILDDYHTLRPDNSALHATVAHLALRLPPQVHLVLASRTTPRLPLAALRKRHRLLELGTADLQFTLAETRAFLDLHVDLDLAGEEIVALHTHTAGWVVALQLATLSLREQADPHKWIDEFNGESGHIFEYLVEEVVRRMPAHLSAFVLQIAPLRRLSGPLCDAVTRAENGQAMLEEMTRADLFLEPLDDRSEWYRLHPLFADAMRQRLRQTRPGLEPRIYARASAWCGAHALALDAMDYAFAASESEAEQTADLVEAYIPSALADGYVTLLRDRLERLPEQVVRERPRLSITHAYTLYLTGERSEMLRRLREAEQAIARTERLLDPVELRALRAEVLALRAAFRTLTGEGSPRAQITAFQQASAALPRTHELRNLIAFHIGINQALDGNVRAASQSLEGLMRASPVQGNGFSTGHIMLSLGLTMLLQGRLDAALALCVRLAWRLPEHGAEAPGTLQACAHLIRGKALYERGEPARAVDHLRRGVSLGYDPGIIAIEAFSTLAHAQLALGHRSAAEQTMEQSIALWEEAQAEGKAIWMWTGRLARAHQAHLWLVHGDLESAAAWARDLRRSVDTAPAYRAQPPAYLLELEDIVLARLYLAEHRASDALTLLNTLRDASEADGRLARLLEILALQAVAQHALDDTPAALETLRRAVEIGWRQRFIRPFIEGGPTIERLLTLLESERASQDVSHGVSQGVNNGNGRSRREVAPRNYIRRLLDAFSPAQRPRRRRSAWPSAEPGAEAHAPQPSTPKLTPREREVLRLIAEGASNDDIARTLVIAASTAKRHVSNIYAALDVRRRTQAVARARAYGLLIPDGRDQTPPDRDA